MSLGGEETNPAQDATRGAGVRVGTEVIVRSLSIVATLILARRLGVEGFGEFVATLSAGVLLAEFADLGLTHATVPALVQGRATVTDLFRAKVVLTAAAVGAAGVAVGFCGALGFDPLVLALVFGHFMGVSWIDQLGVTLRARGLRWAEARLLTVFRATLAGLVIATPLGHDPRLAASAYALAVVPGLALGLSSCRGFAGDGRLRSVPSILRESLPLGVNGYLALAAVRVEILALRFLGGATALGLYAAALRIVESLLTLPAAIAGGALPALSREAGEGVAAARRTVALVLWLALPAAVGLFSRAEEILVVLGAGYGDGAAGLRILSWALVMMFVNTAFMHVLVATRRSRLMVLVSGVRLGVALLVTIGMSAFVFPGLGAPGAAISFAVGETVSCALLLSLQEAEARAGFARAFAGAGVVAAALAVVLLVAPRALPVSIPVSVLAFAALAALYVRRNPSAAGLS